MRVALEHAAQAQREIENDVLRGSLGRNGDEADTRFDLGAIPVQRELIA